MFGQSGFHALSIITARVLIEHTEGSRNRGRHTGETNIVELHRNQNGFRYTGTFRLYFRYTSVRQKNCSIEITMAPDLARAIVCRPPQDGRRQWKLEDIEVYTPAEGEVLVKIIASGVCHTDLGCGSFPDGVGFPVPPYPRVLGHEGGNGLI